MRLEGHVGKDGKQSEKATLALLIGEQDNEERRKAPERSRRGCVTLLLSRPFSGFSVFC